MFVLDDGFPVPGVMRKPSKICRLIQEELRKLRIELARLENEYEALERERNRLNGMG
jgi:hypothetical protein